MYTGEYATKQTEQGRESQKRTNKTGIPDLVKTRFEAMSGYPFDDVRVHYSSDKPAQFMALAYTQGNQVHIAPGQEKYLEHELTHVVQQKEGRVKPTFWMNNVPVNDDKTLEREADIHWSRGRSPVPADGKTFSHQRVLQGQFINRRICSGVYLEQLRNILIRFRDSGKEGPWQYCELREGNRELCQHFLEDYSNIYGQLEAMVNSWPELKRDLARFDILKNLVEHCIGNEAQYEHYHMYQDGSMIHDNNEGDAEVAVGSSLVSAVDCQRKSIKTGDSDFILNNVLWIESFVSLQSGAGKRLLREILNDAENAGVENVALGAYPGTQNYYENILGMQRNLRIYVLEDGGEVVDKREAALMFRRDLEDSWKVDMNEDEENSLINKGLEEFYLYPFYYATKQHILERLER